MKKLILLATLPFLLSSCASTYFYSYLNTETPTTTKVENGDFVFENDSLWIAHSFNGENAPIQITVYNKLNVPMYVDWGRSALIIQDQAISYIGNVMQFQGSSNTYTNGYDRAISDISGKMSLPSNVTFIPPKTKVSNSNLNLNFGIESMNRQPYRSTYMGNKLSERKTVKRADFSPQEAPFKFTSYVTIYTIPDKPQSYEQDFYISSLIKTNAISPKNLPGDMSARGDIFYIEKPANNTGWEVLLGASIIAGAAVLNAKTNYGSNTYYY
ncbi:hypothetical protein E2605_07250 [Dysgonomonas capnocytophagoides]|uniref:Uncharacterized protein n=1 Tax=Dysgonomonas capnocytophagoides TaxID=45254 RepID=A0A4Y8L592_9BACT|nr:hypothetical protein [Dysgonomonas capnocytophagoides]TFD97457.1 hypothetical protein E2605_07250 [Dysgonomonas capnocytophagoides]